MVICKSRSENRGFPIQHVDLTSAAYAIFLSQNNAQAEQFSSGSTNTWNNTAASSSVVTLGNNANNNKDGDSYIMYAFAEKQGYSKFSSFVGNGNADGAFVYLGFKPAFIIYKNITSAREWILLDNKRLGYNPNNNSLFPNNSDTGADGSAVSADLLSNGFKLRTTSEHDNESGNTFIYMAFAENPFVTSTGVPACAR